MHHCQWYYYSGFKFGSLEVEESCASGQFKVYASDSDSRLGARAAGSRLRVWLGVLVLRGVEKPGTRTRRRPGAELRRRAESSCYFNSRPR